MLKEFKFRFHDGNNDEVEIIRAIDKEQAIEFARSISSKLACSEDWDFNQTRYELVE